VERDLPSDAGRTDLFALERLLRAGREARAAAQELVPARRDAEWQVEQDWEPDVPHLAVLGQAISVLVAAGEDPPTEWVRRLAATAAELAVRRRRFSLASSPGLLAPVLRGMAVAGLTPPSAILEHVRSYLAASPDPVVAAELGEALCRHRANSALSKQAMVATFGTTKEGVVVAVARWWLVERWRALCAEPPPVKASDIEEARTQALSLPVSAGSAAAMLAEVTGRNLGRLVIVSLTALGEIREGLRHRTIVENLVWRALFV